jgi:hypothetical protein
MYEIRIKYFDGIKKVFEGNDFDDALSKAREASEAREKSDSSFRSKVRSRRDTSAPIFTIIRRKKI